MKLDPALYLHDSDKAALTALKAIPGFAQVTKAFMKIWNENQYRILNMSTNLKIGENQMKKYYDMLPPICEKLGIEVPEIYVSLDVYPNAYCYGDTKPFIVLTSGLFETIPDELIPTVIAHECGHIACHHTLYRTMGNAILRGTSAYVSGLGSIALYPIMVAFSYWMRCSEFSADRAALICDGSADKIIEMCMRFSGWDKDINATANVDAFIDQANEYRELISDSAWNKALEFILLQNVDHPLNAVRAYEARECTKCDRFHLIVDCLNCSSAENYSKLPVYLNPKKMIGKNVDEVCNKLISDGFANISQDRLTDKSGKEKSGEVVAISIDSNVDVKEDYYDRDAEIIVQFYEDKTEEEIAAEHPGEIKIEENSRYYLGIDVRTVCSQLTELGFKNLVIKEMALPKFGILGKEKTIAKVQFGELDHFEKNTWFSPETNVVLYYYVKI